MNHLQYYLGKLAEEASEIAQIALKTQQFGLNKVYQTESNRTRIHAELNDLMGVIAILNEKFDFGYEPSATAIIAKAEKVNKYLHYSIQLGMVDES